VSIAFDDSATSGPATKLAAAAAGLVLLVVLLAAGAGAGVASLLGGGGTTPSATATSAIPPAMLALYQEAATTCPGLPWTVLAAIGTVESDNGTSTLPGVSAGQNAAGAMGPMQMLGPTFAAYDTPVPPGGASPPSPYDPTDAVYAAARMLCANGAANGAGSGIAPLISIVRYAAARGATTPMTLLCSSRDRSTVLFRQPFEELDRSQPWLSVVHTFTRDSADPYPRFHRRIDAAMIDEVTVTSFGSARGDATYLVAGPPDMVTTAHHVLAELGVSDTRISSEDHA